MTNRTGTGGSEGGRLSLVARVGSGKSISRRDGTTTAEDSGATHPNSAAYAPGGLVCAGHGRPIIGVERGGCRSCTPPTIDFVLTFMHSVIVWLTIAKELRRGQTFVTAEL